MSFKVVKKTVDGRVLLSRDVPQPATKQPLYHRKKRVGVVEETIGRVELPFYVGRVDAPYGEPGTVLVEE